MDASRESTTRRTTRRPSAKGEDGANKFRHLLRRHFSHVASRPGVREGLFAYELWGGLTSAEMIRHVTGLYQMWDELLARCPNLLIDNCASGGRRIDIETMRRAIPFFRSDYQCGFNANADVLQAHNAGISRLLSYNGCTVKLSDAYSLRSAYSASHGVAYWNAIFQKEEKVDWAAAKKCCDEYRRIRKYFPCDFYNHGSAGLDPTA